MSSLCLRVEPELVNGSHSDESQKCYFVSTSAFRSRVLQRSCKHDIARCTYRHSSLQSFCPDQTWYLFLSLVTDAHSTLKGSRKSDPRHVTTQTIIFQHHGSVTLVDVACLVTWRSGAQSLVVVARSLIVAAENSRHGEIRCGNTR